MLTLTSMENKTFLLIGLAGVKRCDARGWDVRRNPRSRMWPAGVGAGGGIYSRHSGRSFDNVHSPLHPAFPCLETHSGVCSQVHTCAHQTVIYNETPPLSIGRELSQPSAEQETRQPLQSMRYNSTNGHGILSNSYSQVKKQICEITYLLGTLC